MKRTKEKQDTEIEHEEQQAMFKDKISREMRAQG